MSQTMPTKLYLAYKNHFDSMEGYFAQILSREGKGDCEKELRGLSRNLKSIFRLNADISIAPDSGQRGEFFGMQVYPKEHRVFAVAEYTAKGGKDIVKMTDLLRLDDVIIEIDEKILTRYMKATPEELVAALIHEVGHICYDNSYMRRYLNALTIQRERMTIRFRALTGWNESIFAKLFSVPFLEAMTSKSWQSDVLKSEVQADKIVVEYGYGEHLQSMLGKIVKLYGTNKINRTRNELINDITAMFQWITDHLNARYIRQAFLQTAINGEIIRNPSPYAKRILQAQLPKHDHKSVEPHEIAHYESSINQIADRYVIEGVFRLFDKTKKVKEVKQSDIDYIQLQVDKMRNHDDRMFVLDLIYDQMDLVEATEELIANGKIDLVRMNESKVKRFKEQLLDLRKQVLDKKLDPDGYRAILIRYPKGYEG